MELAAERDAVIAEVYSAFDGISRQGGISWSEADVIDSYGSPAECKAARSRDTELQWQDLVDDPTWVLEICFGGFSFLDPIGFRYYLPAAMVRTISDWTNDVLQFHLTPRGSDAEYTQSKWSALNQAQLTCVARFIRYMAAEASARGDVVEAGHWQETLDSHWAQF